MRKSSKHRAIGLVEGTAGIGKTTLVDGLLQHHQKLNQRFNTFLRLGQGHTYSPLNPDSVEPQHTAAEQLDYLNHVVDVLSFFSHPLGAGSNPPISCIIETLHLTLANKPNVLSEEQIARYDQKLADIDCKLIFIRVESDLLWERCIWERRHNGFITIYSQKYGDSLEQIHAHYLQEQERMLAHFYQSKMEKILVDGREPIDSLVNKAYDFWIDSAVS